MKTKKTHVLILTGLAAAAFGTAAAFGAPADAPAPAGNPINPGVPQGPAERMQRSARIPDSAPEEIKNAYTEMKSARKDLRLELQKDHPDGEKAMSLFRKAEELRTKVREWEIRQILDGNAKAPAPRRDVRGPKKFRSWQSCSPWNRQGAAGVPAWGPCGCPWHERFAPNGNTAPGAPAPEKTPVQNGGGASVPMAGPVPVPQTPAAN
jgi:hypothetical protein